MDGGWGMGIQWDVGCGMVCFCDGVHAPNMAREGAHMV